MLFSFTVKKIYSDEFVLSVQPRPMLYGKVNAVVLQGQNCWAVNKIRGLIINWFFVPEIMKFAAMEGSISHLTSSLTRTFAAVEKKDQGTSTYVL